MAGTDKGRLLIVEDDEGLRKQMSWTLEGYDIAVAGDRSEALEQLARHRPEVVTLDLGLPPDPANASEGLACLAEILEAAPETKVIVITGNQERDNAVAAIGRGASDFYSKPLEPDTLNLVVERAFRMRRLEEENRRLSKRMRSSPLPGVVAASESMLRVCATIERLADTNATILLLGESGTGKEVLARALHDLSGRRSGPFVAINCAAIPENLLESELFGHEKGAFTGAVSLNRGKIEHADGGTLLLDEIGDLPLQLQAKLLRFLQERQVERIGGRKPIPVDIRVICATHRDLGELIAEGGFRQDLYYRVAEVPVEIPPLREREMDALLIARTLLTSLEQELGCRSLRLSQAAERALLAHDWPGNVRELENRIRRAAILCEAGHITPEALELSGGGEEGEAPLPTLKAARERAEEDAVRRALLLHEGRISAAAEALDVSRPTLYSLIKKYGLQDAAD